MLDTWSQPARNRTCRLWTRDAGRLRKPTGKWWHGGCGHQDWDGQLGWHIRAEHWNTQQVMDSVFHSFS